MILNEAALSHGCFKVKVLAIKKWPVQKEGLKNLVKGLHSKTWAGFSSEATDGKAASSYYHRKLTSTLFRGRILAGAEGLREMV
jgi:hypothetical protein